MRLVQLTLLALLVGAVPAAAGPIGLTNGSFETGDFTGWTLSNPIGIGEFSGPIAAGFTWVQPDFLAHPSGPNPYEAAIDGGFLAAIGTGNHWFLPGQGDFTISATQEVYLAAGATISGASFFYNGDTAFQDEAWVRLRNGNGEIVATPWRQCSGGLSVDPLCPNSVAFGDSTPWVTWEWTPTVSGFYTIELAAHMRGGDNRLASFGVHDRIQVPEPPLLPLFGLSLLLLAVHWMRATRARRTQAR